MLLGLWGGLAPFIGHYLHFGYTPDTAWGWTVGRLYFSLLPGAAVLAGGLLIVTTRSRIVGVLGGVFAALGGLWFVVGSGVMYSLLKQTTIQAGTPLGATFSSTGQISGGKAYLEFLALYTALGALIIFFAALGCGRLSLISLKDAEEAESIDFNSTPEYAGSTTGEFPSVSGQFSRPSQPLSGDDPQQQ
jgi:hypothetical protein